MTTFVEKVTSNKSENMPSKARWIILYGISCIVVFGGIIAIIANGYEYVLNIFDFFDFPIEEDQSEKLAWSLVAALLFMHIGNFADKMRRGK